MRGAVEQRELVVGDIRVVVREADYFWVDLCIQVRSWLYWIRVLRPRVRKQITELNLLMKEAVIME